ncbi:hypothetical protein Forpe1208_v003548 [Fusarium oxysporum f. sp. rapae]|uniref:Uncharacterized protein n=1 Tax=Fusarium oxysporum f. sp. rapae TaxID=485398 RepID=A0A8J5TN19_FUSOX|nr:hypothetical protein Forpe1208_v015974 [Fusarium oxysporum f. sp. rapae]KAG7420020.1 hypothetical protein Forpe1208_v003548 [Fusarium oxysporum f. sp. rapae]
MSSSIAIPAGPSATPSCHKGTGSSANSPYSTSPSCSPPSAGEDKALYARRLSFLGWLKPDPLPTRRSFLSKQECTVINIGEPNSPPRLICYVSSSQGFTWNPEIFLPSCIDCDYVPLENRRDPVDEIFLTDEESMNMLPQ